MNIRGYGLQCGLNALVSRNGNLVLTLIGRFKAGGNLPSTIALNLSRIFGSHDKEAYLYSLTRKR